MFGSNFKNQFGYGRYVFNVKSRVDMLDANAVLGIFLWDPNALKDYNHEVDIELSKWSSTNNMNAQFVVQQYHSRKHKAVQHEFNGQLLQFYHRLVSR